MDARFYNSEDIDIERLATDVVNVYLSQGYQAQQIGNRDQILVQLKKGGDFEAILGMQAALSLTLQRTAGGVLAMIGQQRWIDKAAVGAVGIVALPILWPLAITAGVGAFRQASLGNQVLNIVDGLVRQQRPSVQIGPVPAQIVPQIQQQWAPPPALPAPTYVPSTHVYVPPAQVVYSQPTVSASTGAPASAPLRCTSCNTPYEAGDTFCSGCGRALTPPKLYCSNCNTEVKSGTAFCPRCGASTFNTVASAQSSGSTPATYTPPAPVYTPPQPAAPVYTAPTPPTPVYTPPTPATPASVPQPTVYYAPSTQSAVDPSAPTVAASSPPKPSEPYYVPPATQEPVTPPKPKVTIVPSAPKQEPPPPKPRPQKQYYIPSNQEQTVPADQALPAMPAVPLPATDSNVIWGSLIFDSGQQIELQNDHAIVGRYDHDLGGMQPDVDLSQMVGSDTISRVHAALEHVGSAYTLTDLNSTNATRINSKRLEPDTATPINDGDTLQFGKVTCTFHKV